MQMSIYKELSRERKDLQKRGEIPSWVTTSSWQMLKEKYLDKGESFKDRIFEIAGTASSYMNPKGEDSYDIWYSKFYKLLWDGFLIPSTPVMASMGKEVGCSVSCSGGVIDDSVYGFYEGQKEVALLSKHGFGTSGYLGAIRPRGSKITGIRGSASGVLPVFKDYVQVSRDISQGSQRRGAWAGYIEIDHPDYFELVSHISKSPDDANIGWIISDEFINRLDSGDKDAIERYQKALKLKMVHGKGYFFFVDKVNRLAPEVYKDHRILASNLCTEIALPSNEDETFTCQPNFAPIIKEGGKISCIGELQIGDKIWSKEGWTKVVNKKCSGVKQVYKYVTSKGSFIGTEDHKVLENGEKIEVKYASKIDITPNISTFSEDVKIIPEYVINGLLLGDGTVRNNKICLCIGDNDYDYFESEIKDYIGHKYKYVYDIECSNILVDIRKKTYDRDINVSLLDTFCKKISFLRGLYSANGSICKQPSGVNIVLSQSSEKIIDSCSIILKSIGMSPSKYRSNGALTSWKNGEYKSRDRFFLIISRKKDIELFKKIGFIQEYKNSILKEIDTRKSVDTHKSSKIIDIIDLGMHEVFHIEVDNVGHTYSTDGLEVSNCVLSSLNLSRWKEFEEDTIYNSLVFLHCVALDFINKGKNIEGLEKAVRFTENHMALGLGALGFATYLQDNMIPFESLEAHLWNIEVFKTIDEETRKASQWLAKVFGECKMTKGTGYANTTRIAIAPNLSSALIGGGLSQGIEAVYKNAYYQGTAAGEVERINPSLLPIMKKRGVFNRETIKRIITNKGSIKTEDWLSDYEKIVFKTAFEVDQRIIIRLASARQRFIDQAQSINLFFSSDEKEEYISEVHKEAFKDPYIKSLYYIRSESGVQTSKGECLSCHG